MQHVTHLIVSRWMDGDVIGEQTIGSTLADAVGEIDARTIRILRLAFDGLTYTTTDVSEEAALMLADHYSGDRDELKPFIADFIDTHAPDLFDERAENVTDYAREERTWGL